MSAARPVLAPIALIPVEAGLLTRAAAGVPPALVPWCLYSYTHTFSLSLSLSLSLSHTHTHTHTHTPVGTGCLGGEGRVMGRLARLRVMRRHARPRVMLGLERAAWRSMRLASRLTQ
jgi:hypothetical protein